MKIKKLKLIVVYFLKRLGVIRCSHDRYEYNINWDCIDNELHRIRVENHCFDCGATMPVDFGHIYRYIKKRAANKKIDVTNVFGGDE